MRVLITGSTGFVGSALTASLGADERFRVRAARRGAVEGWGTGAEQVVVSDISAGTDWKQALAGVDAVVHLAARVHVMRERSANPLDEFRRVNVAGTLNLARQAAAQGVRRFVYVSTAKVNGEGRPLRIHYLETDTPEPADAYATSKHEAETGLRDVAAKTGMATTIVRPPLVYGRGVRANFGALIRAVAWGIPLPLGAVKNKRSFVGVDNLVDLLRKCIEHPAAANETFLVSDGEDLSTPELIRRLALAMGRPARLVSVPVGMLRLGATLIGRRDAADRLLGSLQLDIGKARALLGWTPSVSVDEGLRRAVATA